jgi:hypothetical protein
MKFQRREGDERAACKKEREEADGGRKESG